LYLFSNEESKQLKVTQGEFISRMIKTGFQITTIHWLAEVVLFEKPSISTRYAIAISQAFTF